MYEADFQLELAAIEAESIGWIPLESGAYYGVAFDLMSTLRCNPHTKDKRRIW